MKLKHQRRQKRQGKLPGLMLAVVGVSSLLLVGGAAKAYAFGRDADGSRPQARHQEIGTTQRDTLNPPRDAVDWRSFKVTDDKPVSVVVRHKPEAISLNVELVDASGQTVASAKSVRGAATLSATLKPGLYYISVSAGQGVSYSIAIQ